MSDRIFRLAMRAVPPAVRESDGAAIVGMATDMIDGGQSTTAKEARGIASYGVKKRIALNLDWLRSLPWGDALRALALPIAIAQVVALVYTARGFDSPASAWPGGWAAVALLAGVLTIIGAASRKRMLLGAGAAALLALFLADTYGSGGSMLGGMSHTQDFSFAWIRDTIMAPMALVMIPTTLLLLAAALSGPTTGPASSNREVRGLAVGILLASQAPLIGLQLGFTFQSTAMNHGGSIAFAFLATAIAIVLLLAGAFALVRRTAGPRELT